MQIGIYIRKPDKKWGPVAQAYHNVHCAAITSRWWCASVVASHHTLLTSPTLPHGIALTEREKEVVNVYPPPRSSGAYNICMFVE